MLNKTFNPKFLVMIFLAFVLLTGCQQAPAPEPEPVPQPNNDLIFSPAEIAVAPGGANSVTVQVTSEANVSNATFELNQAADGVTLSFQPEADGKSGELFIELAEAKPEGSQDLSIKGTDGTHVWFGSLKLTAAVTAPVTRFVNPSTGNDANAGTSAKPFKTIAKALSVSKSGDTVKLAAGTYGALSFGNGEKFPLTVPSGVKLVGTLASNGAKQSFLSTTGGTADDLALTFAGDATVKDLEIDAFGVAMQATTGKQTLSNLNLILNDFGLNLKGSAKTSLLNVEMFLGAGDTAVNLSQQAQLTMTGGTVENIVNGAKGLSLTDTATATVTGSTFKVNGGIAMDLVASSKATVVSSTMQVESSEAVRLQGSAQATLQNTTINLANTGDFFRAGVEARDEAQLTVDGGSISAGAPSCANVKGVTLSNSAKATLKNNVTLTNLTRGSLEMNDTTRAILSQVKIETAFLNANCGQSAISTRDAALLSLEKTVMTGLGATSNSFGILFDSSVPLVVDTSTISGFSGAGIFATASGTTNVTNSTLSGNDIGIDVGSASDIGTIFVFASSFVGNNIGIRGNALKLRNSSVVGSDIGIAAGGINTDLGTLSEPGNNTLTNNNVSVTFIKRSTEIGFVKAVGNTWNANTQGTDGGGHYTTHFVATPSSPNAAGHNYDFSNTPNIKDKIQF